MSARAATFLLVVASICGSFALTRLYDFYHLSGRAHSPADYVRDPWHERKRDSSPNFDENTQHVGSDGTVYTIWGWKTWTCKSGIQVSIGNNEEQP